VGLFSEWRSIQEINRLRWRRLVTGVMCISCLITGAVFDAVRNGDATRANSTVIRSSSQSETVVFEPPDTTPDASTYVLRGSGPDASR
jgi:hypothetical protein